MKTTVLYGLRIETTFDLHDSGARAQGASDVVIRAGETLRAWEPQPPGQVILDFETHEPWYTLVRLADGSYHYRVHTIGDFLIDPNASDVEMRLHADVAPGMDAIMTTGTLMSLLLFLRGASVFHGSGVAVGSQAVGFVGHSGQGKTTMATLFCSQGASVITDDVLVIDSPGTTPKVRRGSRELRLRPGAAELVDRFADSATRESADHRQILAPAHAQNDATPLKAILVPIPTRDGSPLRFERLAQKDAAFALISFPRLMGWRDPGILQQLFLDATAIASTTPVMAAYVPWGPPFPDDLVGALEQALGQ